MCVTCIIPKDSEFFFYSNSWNDPNELSFELLIALNVRIDGVLIIRGIFIRWIDGMLYVLDITERNIRNYWIQFGGMELFKKKFIVTP